MDTQMPLLPSDLKRLASKTRRDIDEFSIRDEADGPRRLRNIDGQCVFLNETGCSIYEDRPAGCRLYPLVMDPDTHQGILDPDCPHTRHFRIRPRDRAALADLVHRLGLRLE
jgi:uncharacterized protein